MTHLSIYSRYTIKNRTTPGYSGGHITYGKDKYLKPHEMMFLVIYDIFRHCAEYETADTLRESKEKIIEYLQNIEIEDPK